MMSVAIRGAHFMLLLLAAPMLSLPYDVKCRHA